jgi:hypothetical protein
MVRFIDDHRIHYGVEPICRVLPIAPSTYFRHKAQEKDPTKRSAGALLSGQTGAAQTIPHRRGALISDTGQCGARPTADRGSEILPGASFLLLRGRQADRRAHLS